MTDSEPKPMAPRRILRRWVRIWMAFAPFGRRHRRSFLTGWWFATLVVACRLALPWPLRTFLAPALASPPEIRADAAGADSSMDPLFWSAVFLVIAIALGWAEFRQRLWMARFSIGWVRDIRAETFRAAKDLDARYDRISTGDLVARLVGDTARLKAGLQGFMTHVATNGLLFLGVVAILGSRSLVFGGIFLATAFLLMGIAMVGASRVYLRSKSLRRKEGKLAVRIERALDSWSDESSFAKVNYSSGQHEASVVRLQGLTTMAAHLLIGAVTVTTFWVGMAWVRAGRLSSDDLVLILLYALTLHHPSVRLARQCTRIGKMFACGDRLERLLRAAAWSRSLPAIEPLSKAINVRSVSVKVGRAERRRYRLYKVSMKIRKGERVAILGAPGSGKSSLVELIAGRLAPRRGKVSWDTCSYARISSHSLRQHLGYLRANPVWSAPGLGALLAAGDAPAADPSRGRILDLCGADDVLDRIPPTLRPKIRSADLSQREAKALALAALLLEPKPVMLLDEPFESLPPDHANGIMELLAGDPGRTVVVALESLEGLRGFDRVIRMEAGSVVFDGDLRSWLSGKDREFKPEV